MRESRENAPRAQTFADPLYLINEHLTGVHASQGCVPHKCASHRRVPHRRASYRRASLTGMHFVGVRDADVHGWGL
jgi:hypothetical protein